jgi:hypothetical protein
VKTSAEVDRLSGVSKAYWGNNGGQYEKIQGTSIGWSAGIYSRIGIKKKLFFIPELQFAKRHYDIAFFYYPLSMGFIQLNSIFSYKKWRRIAIEGGPYFGQRILFNSNAPYAANLVNIGFNLKGEAGAIVGIRSNLGKSLVVIGRLVYGITPIANKIFGDDLGDKWRLRLHNSSVELGLACHLGKLN